MNIISGVENPNIKMSLDIPNVKHHNIVSVFLQPTHLLDIQVTYLLRTNEYRDYYSKHSIKLKRVRLYLLGGIINVDITPYKILLNRLINYCTVQEYSLSMRLFKNTSNVYNYKNHFYCVSELRSFQFKDQYVIHPSLSVYCQKICRKLKDVAKM